MEVSKKVKTINIYTTGNVSRRGKLEIIIHDQPFWIDKKTAKEMGGKIYEIYENADVPTLIELEKKKLELTFKVNNGFLPGTEFRKLKELNKIIKRYHRDIL